eukprot:comp17974_c0_seq1/m.18350 comp17974_c0_seq1/g.18350  ORF comp17974_c0_seq1/g.18350 comp17974_c0_seq1/m.18350 type:complete len:557 (-) comp17974_c0_seq1:87-1757(-)
MEGKRARAGNDSWDLDAGWMVKRKRGASAGGIEGEAQEQEPGQSNSPSLSSSETTSNQQKSQNAENGEMMTENGEDSNDEEEESSGKRTQDEEDGYPGGEKPENGSSAGQVVLVKNSIYDVRFEDEEDSDEIQDSYDFHADKNAHLRNSGGEIGNQGDSIERNEEEEEEEEGIAREYIFHSVKNSRNAGNSDSDSGVERKRALWYLDAPPFLFKSAKQVFNTQQEELIKNAEPQSSKKQIKKEIDDRWHYLDTIALNRAEDMWKATVDEYELLYDRYKEAYPEVVLKPPPSRLAQIPKKPHNAFQLFYGDMCALSKESGKKFGLVQAQKEWKTLSDDEKFPYVEAYKKLEQEFKKNQREMADKTKEAEREQMRFSLASKPKTSNSALVHPLLPYLPPLKPVKRITSDPCEYWIQQKTPEYRRKKGIAKNGTPVKVQMKNHWDNLDNDTRDEWIEHHKEVLSELDKSLHRPDIIWSFNVGNGLFAFLGKKESMRLSLDLAKFIHGAGPAIVETKHQSKRYHVHLASMVMRRANGKAENKEIKLRMQVVDKGVKCMLK